jgi:hypothetical protein
MNNNNIQQYLAALQEAIIQADTINIFDNLLTLAVEM